MVFVSTEELENRLRRDLLVDEDGGGEVGVHAWARTKEMVISPYTTWMRPPCAGHAMLAALEVDEAVLEEEDIVRASRCPRMKATMNMVATPIRHRQDVWRSNLCTTLNYAKCANNAARLAVGRHRAGLRAGISRVRRDAYADVAEQPDGVGNERREDHTDGEDGVPQYPPPRCSPRLPRRPNTVDASGGDVDDVSRARRWGDK
jgi:hypothetical protein